MIREPIHPDTAIIRRLSPGSGPASYQYPAGGCKTPPELAAAWVTRCLPRQPLRHGRVGRSALRSRSCSPCLWPAISWRVRRHRARRQLPGEPPEQVGPVDRHVLSSRLTRHAARCGRQPLALAADCPARGHRPTASLRASRARSAWPTLDRHPLPRGSVPGATGLRAFCRGLCPGPRPEGLCPSSFLPVRCVGDRPSRTRLRTPQTPFPGGPGPPHPSQGTSHRACRRARRRAG